MGARLELVVKCYKSRKPESGYNRTKYRLRGFHSGTVFHSRAIAGPVNVRVNLNRKRKCIEHAVFLNTVGIAGVKARRS